MECPKAMQSSSSGRSRQLCSTKRLLVAKLTHNSQEATEIDCSFNLCSWFCKNSNCFKFLFCLSHIYGNGTFCCINHSGIQNSRFSRKISVFITKTVTPYRFGFFFIVQTTNGIARSLYIGFLLLEFIEFTSSNFRQVGRNGSTTTCYWLDVFVEKQ